MKEYFPLRKTTGQWECSFSLLPSQRFSLFLIIPCSGFLPFYSIGTIISLSHPNITPALIPLFIYLFQLSVWMLFCIFKYLCALGLHACIPQIYKLFVALPIVMLCTYLIHVCIVYRYEAHWYQVYKSKSHPSWLANSFSIYFIDNFFLGIYIIGISSLYMHTVI